MSHLSTPSWVDRDLWPYAPRTHALDEGRLHYVDEGTGPPLLLVHGTPTWSIDWRHVIAGLRDVCRCIAVDHLGFGLSDRPLQGVGYAPEDHAARFARFADALDLRDVTLVVHDFGGPIALPWALANVDRLARVVLVNTWAWPLGDDWRMAAGARLLGSPLGRWAYRALNLSLTVVAPSAYADRSKLTRALHDQWKAPFAEPAARVPVLWTLARSLLASRDHYAALEAALSRLRDVPVHVLWGERDPAFPTSVRDGWASGLPHAEPVSFPEAGHWPHEEAAEDFVAALRARVAQGRPTGSA